MEGWTFSHIIPSSVDLAQGLSQGIEIINQSGQEIWLKTDNLQTLNSFISTQISAQNLLTGMEEILPSLNEIFIKTIKRQQEVVAEN